MSKKNLILVFILVVIIIATGYFVLNKKSDILSTGQPSTQNNSAATTTPSTTQTKTQANKDYKKLISLSFDRGNGAQQFGAILSLYTDNANNVYLLDGLNNKVVGFDGNGKPLFNVTIQKQLGAMAVDNNENIYAVGTDSNGNPSTVLKYDSKGNLLGKIDDPTALSEPGCCSLYVFANALYTTGFYFHSTSTLISSIDGPLKTSEPSKVVGMYGLDGQRYNVRDDYMGISHSGDQEFNFDQLVHVDILSPTGAVKTLTLSVHNLSFIRFSGEDQNGDLYFETDVVGTAPGQPATEIRKYDSSGNLLTVLSDFIPDGYSSLQHVDRAGDIWQVLQNDSKIIINKWSTN